jgi:hypothetical protein
VAAGQISMAHRYPVVVRTSKASEVAPPKQKQLTALRMTRLTLLTALK